MEHASLRITGAHASMAQGSRTRQGLRGRRREWHTPPKLLAALAAPASGVIKDSWRRGRAARIGHAPNAIHRDFTAGDWQHRGLAPRALQTQCAATASTFSLHRAVTVRASGTARALVRGIGLRLSSYRLREGILAARADRALPGQTLE